MILRMRGGGIEFPRHPVVVGVLPWLNGEDEGVAGRIALARQMAADGADWVEWSGGGAAGEAEEAAGLRAFLERWSGEGQALPVVIRTARESAARLALEAGGNMLCGGGVLGVEAAARMCADTGAALLLTHVFEGAEGEAATDSKAAFARSAEAFFEESLSLVERAGLSLDAVLLDAGDAPGGIPGGCVQRELMERLGRPWSAPVSGRRLGERVLGGGFDTPGSTSRSAALVACVVQAVLAGAHILRVEHAGDVRAAVYAARTIAAVLGGGRA